MATTHEAPIGAVSPRRGAPPHPPDLTVFTLVHRAMRRDAGRLARAVSGLGDGESARARALRRWYGDFHAELTGHHRIEDELWFPVLAERVPTYAEHTDRIDHEHHLLEDALAGADAALDRLAAEGGTASARGPARDATCELSELVDAHLGFEDADIVPLFLRHFTEDEFVEVERRTRRMLEARRLPFAVPWIMDAATPPERSRVLGRAPVALKLVWYASRRRHARRSARALGPAPVGTLEEVA
jgi:Hemerythrin HHE cation binding domain